MSEKIAALARVETQHNDNGRTGANLNELVLTTANVNQQQFGKLFQRSVDGQIYAQPLYSSGIDMPGKGPRNVVYVATMHNTVYAFDADDANLSAPLWSVSLGPAIALPDANIGPPGYRDIEVEVGVLSTPVLSMQSNAMYVVAASKAGAQYRHTLHALNLNTGAEMFGGPVTIGGSVHGTGDGSRNGTVTFISNRQLQRAALLLHSDNLYIAFASYGDEGPYHGWVFSYDARTLQRTAIYNTSPNGEGAGIWQSGQGLAADDNGIYFLTGNGSFSLDASAVGDSFVKLDFDLKLKDWFSPFNNADLDAADQDLGSSGVLLIPGTNLMVGGGKEGKFYLLRRTNLGHFNAAGDTQIVQSFYVNRDHHIHGGPLYWDGPLGACVYVWPENDFFKAYRFNDGLFQTTPISVSTTTAPGNVPGGSVGMPGGMLSLSANGSTPGTGVVWASHAYDKDANQQVVNGIVYAYDASDLSKELWNSKQNSARDDIGKFAKFCSPTVVNGKVYVASFSGYLAVYGLLSSDLNPAIRTDGVVNGASYGSAIASNTWISIFGNDLSTVTRSWDEGDFQDNNLPTELEGVSVRINDEPAFVSFVSPEQLNVLTPADLPQGPAAVQVSLNGRKSNPETVQVSELAPAWFLFNTDDPKYVAALHSDGTPCGNPSLMPGLSTPAAAGETIELYATGLGETNPPFPPGKVIDAPLPVSRSVAIQFGEQNGEVFIADLTSAGRYQITVKIPETAPDGDLLVRIEIGGETSQEDTFLTVQSASAPP
jgi:uncharacterized protein (TIGR03437 family)